MSDNMVRKQIYLPKKQNLKLKRLAEQRGVSEAEVIRQALEREFEMPVAIERDSKEVLAGMITFARSLRERPEFKHGKPYVFDREEVYADRESRWDRSQEGK